MFTEIEQETLDIDWFFTNNEDIAFVASGGGRLPESVSKLSENYDLLLKFFRELPETSGIIVNKDLSKIIGSIADDRYLEDFVYMTKRGLFSFDKTVLGNFEDSHYHLVSKPVSPLKLSQVPNEIRDILIESRYMGNIDTFKESIFIRWNK